MAHSQQPTSPASVDLRRVEAVATTYRSVVVWFGMQYLVGAGGGFVGMSLGSAIGGYSGRWVNTMVILLARLGVIVCGIVMAIHVYKLTEQMGSGAPWAWAIAMFIPCLNIIFLLVLSGNAQTWCRQHGVAVGLLGPPQASIADLRSRLMAEAAAQAQPPPEQAAQDYGPPHHAPVSNGPGGYVRQCRSQGMTDPEIVSALVQAGWQADQAAQLVRNTP